MKEEDMRFLITAKNKFPIPPEIGPGLADATIAWGKKYTANGKIEQLWTVAGVAAGGGIANVNSSDELDAIMTEFPLGPFSEIEVYPLADLVGSMERLKKATQAAAPRG
jgi:muconolactone D-isomerase